VTVAEPPLADNGWLGSQTLTMTGAFARVARCVESRAARWVSRGGGAVSLMAGEAMPRSGGNLTGLTLVTGLIEVIEPGEAPNVLPLD